MPRRSAPDALTLFDSLVYTRQYRVAIDPPGAAHAWVMQVRHQLRARIGHFGGFYRLPGIVLLEAELPPEYERPLCDAVARAASAHRGFGLRFNGLAHTPDHRCIHVAVEGAPSFAPLRDALAAHVRADRRIRKLGVDPVPEPRLPIAEGLKAAQFEEAWSLLANEPFTATHRVHDVVVLKRELTEDSLDEHVRTFALADPS